MKRVLITAFVVLIVSVLIFSGCGTQKAPASPTPAPSPTKPAASPSPTAAKIPMPWDEWPIKQIRPEWKWPEFFVANGTSTRYADAVALTEIVKKYLGMKTQVVDFGTGEQGVSAVVKGDAVVNSVEPRIINAAYLGVREFQGSQPGLVKMLAFVSFPDHFGLIARNGSGINTPADFKGKRIAYPKSTPVWELLMDSVLKAYGMTRDDIKIVYWSKSSELPPMVRENLVDAFALTVKPGSSQLADLRTTGHAYAVGIGADKIDAVVKEMGGLYPKVRITPEVLQEQDRNKELYCVGNYEGLHIRGDVPESLAYSVVRVLWEHNDEFLAAASSIGKGFRSSKDAVNPAVILIGFHPGAIKYYKEIGVWGAEQDAVQQKLETQLNDSLTQWQKTKK